jgi:hypothetical protein
MCCKQCGGSLRRGRTHSGGTQARCLLCQVSALPCIVLRPGKRSRPRAGLCACCGREGKIVGLGLRSACYQRRRAHGKLDEWRAYYQEMP